MGAGRGLKTGGEFGDRVLRRSVAEIDSVVSPAAAAASQAIYAPFHETEPYRDVEVNRDVAYGVHPRQRVDVFRPALSAQRRPACCSFTVAVSSAATSTGRAARTTTTSRSGRCGTA